MSKSGKERKGLEKGTERERERKKERKRERKKERKRERESVCGREYIYIYIFMRDTIYMYER